MEQEAVYFENSIIKSAFHKNKKLINNDEVKDHMVKIHLNTLDFSITVMRKTSTNECICRIFLIKIAKT